jgi:hypothetical protein
MQTRGSNFGDLNAIMGFSGIPVEGVLLLWIISNNVLDVLRLILAEPDPENLLQLVRITSLDLPIPPSSEPGQVSEKKSISVVETLVGIIATKPVSP